MTEVLPIPGGPDTSLTPAVPLFTTFAELADAAHLSPGGQALLRHAQRRIVAALEAAGFRAAAWANRSNPMSTAVRTVYESLKVVDPLNEAVFDIELRFTLTQVGRLTAWHLTTTTRSVTEDRTLTCAEIAYQTWESDELAETYALFQAAFQAHVAPDGIADEVFSALADELSFEVAP